MLTIETDNPDIDVKELSQRVDEKVKRIKKSSSPMKRIVFSVHDKYDKTEKPYLVAQKDAYHINELLCFQGDHFIVNAYRAIIQEKADPKVIEQYNLLFSQGILNKKEILCKLRYSPEGRKNNIPIQGLRSLRFAQ